MSLLRPLRDPARARPQPETSPPETGRNGAPDIGRNGAPDMGPNGAPGTGASRGALQSASGSRLHRSSGGRVHSLSGGRVHSLPGGRRRSAAGGSGRPSPLARSWWFRASRGLEGDRLRRFLIFLLSVRLRAAVAAALTVGAALLIAGFGLYLLVEDSAQSSVNSAVNDELGVIYAETKSADPPQFLQSNPSSALGQVVSSSDQVVASTPSAEGRPPLLPVTSLRAGQSTTAVVKGTDGQPYYVSVIPAAHPAGAFVEAAATEALVDRSTDEVLLNVAVGAPILALLVGVLTWWLVGRALQPVEAIRAEVAELSEEDLDRRVPEPTIEDEIGRLARTMNGMLGRLEGSLERQRRFVADSSHELRSPITTMLAEIEVALAHPDGTDLATVLGDLRSEAERLEHIIDDLLLLARADEGALARRRHRLIDLDDLVADEVARLRRRGRVEVGAAGLSAAQIWGDRDPLIRVVRNLLDNAERHARSRVTVELGEEDGGDALLVVSDDGPGIAPADRERIFERFTRLDDARERTAGGSGLGLAIVRDIVRAHGGSVRVEDSEIGARFAVRLPLSHQDD